MIEMVTKISGNVNPFVLFVDSPKVKLALAISASSLDSRQNEHEAVLFMIGLSIVVLLGGLRYHEGSLDTGAQTIRPGWAGPVSYVLGGMTLTGCFLYTVTCLKFSHSELTVLIGNYLRTQTAEKNRGPGSST